MAARCTAVKMSVLEGADAWRSDTINVPLVWLFIAGERTEKDHLIKWRKYRDAVVVEGAGIDIHFRGARIN